ncbi:MAG: RluA family pseudouridine synthase [Oscillospiraceae bacterium]|nr:RluA family pseudouridine synthase [Oscillospiraceae bacterium]
MREIYIGKRVKPGTRLDEYVMSVFPALPKNALYKAFRKKDIKIGGKWAAPETVIKPMDILNIYLPDDLLFGAQKANGAGASTDAPNDAQTGTPISATIGAPTDAPTGAPIGFEVAYEDERLLIVNKPQGLPVHPDRSGGGLTLIELVREYLGAGAGSPLPGTGGAKLAPYMCHRIDRNTGGLVAIAKDRGALDTLLKALASGAVRKDYMCVVHGKPELPKATLRAYITKNASRGKVAVYPTPGDAPGNAFEIVTRYRTIGYNAPSDTSKLEVSLLTGRTHQIRAHLASAGHPIIGDGKYCPNAINKRYYAPYQMLVAFRLTFPELPGLGVSGKIIEIPDGLEHPALRNPAAL